MNKKFIYLIVGFLTMLVGNAYAQEDLDPTNPPEPFTYYKLNIKATPEGYTYGAGKYLDGTNVNIQTSAYNQNYKFSHWTKNGEYYGDAQSFSFTMPAEKVDFVAVYEYDPVDPSEPVANYSHRLYLTNNITEACSFNRTSGSKVQEDSYVAVTAYVNQGYDFLGWYENGRLVNESRSFSYYMGTESVTLEARFAYNPVNPGEPTSGATEGVDNGTVGDIDGDGIVDISDKVVLVNRYLNGSTSELSNRTADVNRDGVIDISDAVQIVNNYLNSK